MTDAKVTIERATLQAAIDALRYARTNFSGPLYASQMVNLRCHEVEVALRAALRAEQPVAAQPVEPVAWYLPSPDGDDSIFRDHRTVVACTGNKWEGFLPLYAAPAAQQPTAALVPLTDEQIIAIANSIDDDACDQSQTTAFARAIERAHGIGDKP